MPTITSRNNRSDQDEILTPISVLVTPDLKQEVATLAERMKVSRSELFRLALRRFLNR